MATERATVEGARIDLAQSRLKTSGDAELVTMFRSELNVRRSQIDAERGRRVDVERQPAAAAAAMEAQTAKTADLKGRFQAVDSERSAAREGLDTERPLRLGGERERDVSLERVAAAWAEDVRNPDAELRKLMAYRLEPPTRNLLDLTVASSPTFNVHRITEPWQLHGRLMLKKGTLAFAERLSTHIQDDVT